LVWLVNYRIDSGASAVRAVLSQAKIPTVIFCGSDLIAMGAMNALEEAGFQVPEDVSVVGIDDISFAFLARPPLTTISVPRSSCIRSAGKSPEAEAEKGSRLLPRNGVSRSQVDRSCPTESSHRATTPCGYVET
jgi:DNA-binding LacI/PurR family transcriptional regulator